MKKPIKRVRRSSSLAKALNSIAESNKQNAIASKKNAEAIDSIAKTYARVNPVRDKTPFWKFWKRKYEHHHIAAYIIVILTLIGIGIGWNNEMITAHISEIEQQKSEKITLQRELNKIVADARAVVITQAILCTIKHTPEQYNEVARINAVKNIVAINSNIRYVFGQKTSDILTQISKSIYGIKNVCDINKDTVDVHTYQLFHEMTKLIDDSISKDTKEINSLIKSRHRFQVPAEI